MKIGGVDRGRFLTNQTEEKSIQRYNRVLKSIFHFLRNMIETTRTKYRSNIKIKFIVRKVWKFEIKSKNILIRKSFLSLL